MAATLRGPDGLQLDSRNDSWTLFGLLMESIRMRGSVSRPPNACDATYAAPHNYNFATIHQTSTPPLGSLIIPDPYETYLKSQPDGSIPECLVVTKESSVLQSNF